MEIQAGKTGMKVVNVNNAGEKSRSGSSPHETPAFCKMAMKERGGRNEICTLYR
ncbi:hypothetical protein [Rossellomorea vietnamensis]|uniref:hypothetical protein n=1 Tax=Rossellomorea vietnamensis TaxID=218284 RepID=UPI0016535D0B|nr:hypothetical protein [Rossellomorea vietnamensis]